MSPTCCCRRMCPGTFAESALLRASGCSWPVSARLCRETVRAISPDAVAIIDCGGCLILLAGAEAGCDGALHVWQRSRRPLLQASSTAPTCTRAHQAPLPGRHGECTQTWSVPVMTQGELDWESLAPASISRSCPPGLRVHLDTAVRTTPVWRENCY